MLQLLSTIALQIASAIWCRLAPTSPLFRVIVCLLFCFFIACLLRPLFGCNCLFIVLIVVCHCFVSALWIRLHCVWLCSVNASSVVYDCIIYAVYCMNGRFFDKCIGSSMVALKALLAYSSPFSDKIVLFIKSVNFVFQKW